MKREWSTTSESLTYLDEDRRERPETPHPEPPDGDGWELRGAICHYDRVLWFWQRDVVLAAGCGNMNQSEEVYHYVCEICGSDAKEAEDGNYRHARQHLGFEDASAFCDRYGYPIPVIDKWKRKQIKDK